MAVEMKKKNDKGERILTTNRKARHDYSVIETIEAGISLLGSEVKSCVAKEVSISEAYCVIRGGECVMLQSSISTYSNSSYMNHDVKRERVLLLHKKQIRKLKQEVEKNGMTIVPLDMHIAENGRIKVEIGLCRGKNAIDKRQSIKERETKLELKRLAR
jgi:SsrA-binding protein